MMDFWDEINSFRAVVKMRIKTGAMARLLRQVHHRSAKQMELTVSDELNTLHTPSLMKEEVYSLDVY